MSKLNKNLLIIVGYFFIITVLLYVVTYKACLLYYGSKVPTGDAFSYTLNLFYLMDRSSSNGLTSYFFEIFKTITSSDWYYLYKIPIAILAPILIKDAHSIIIINYIYFFIFLFCSFSFIKYFFQISHYKALVVSISLILLPWLWGIHNIVSLQQTTLDPQFYLVGSSYFLILLKFVFEKYNSKTALFAGILGGLFILGRGNSWYYFIFLSTIPLIYLFLTFYKERKNIIFSNFYPLFIYLFSFVVISAWFYFFTLENIINYYFTQQASIKYSELSFDQVLSALKIIYLKSP
jgi:hypothetical protein